MKQLEMFSDESTRRVAARVNKPKSEFTAFPDSLLRRLNTTLRFMQDAQGMPWNTPESIQYEVDLFLGSVER